MATQTEPVLVVDDHEAMRTLLASRLRTLGLTSIQAASLSEALAVLESTPIAAVVSDYSMPGATGLELLAYVRGRWPELPFVLMSAEFPDGVPEAAFAAGANAVVDKATLLGRLERVLEEARHGRVSLAA